MNSLKKERLIVLILVAFVIGLTSIGYALGDSRLSIKGDALVLAGRYNAGLVVVNYSTKGSKDGVFNSVSNSVEATDTADVITSIINASFKSDDVMTLTLNVKNESSRIYTFDDIRISQTFKVINDYVDLKKPRVYGINKGDKIKPGEIIPIRIIYLSDLFEHTWNNGNLSSTVELVFDRGEKNLSDHMMLVNLEKDNITFNSRNIASTKVSVKNLYPCSYDVKFTISNTDLTLLNYAGGSGRSTEYNIIFDSNEERTLNLQFSIDEMPEDDITTNLYIIEGEKTPRLVGEIKISPYKKPEVPGGSGEAPPVDPDDPNPPVDPDEPEDIIIENISATVTTSGGAYNPTSTIVLDVRNDNDFDLNEWEIVIHYDKSIGLTAISESNTVATFDDGKGTIKVTSSNKWTPVNNAIKAHSTYQIRLTATTTKQEWVQVNEWYGYNSYTVIDVTKATLNGKVESGEWSYLNSLYQK